MGILRAFQQRIADTNSAHTNLRSHLSRTMQEIYEQEKHINQLQGAIRSMVRLHFRMIIYHIDRHEAVLEDTI